MAVTLSAAAAERVRRFAQGTRTPALRLAVKKTGCSGFAYVVDLAEAPSPGDHVFRSHGVSVVVDAAALEKVDGTAIDFERDGLNEGFTYANPNVKGQCGCGESFSVG